MSRLSYAIVLALVLLASQLIPAPGQSRETPMTATVEARNKAIVQEKFDAWRAGTGGPFELLSDDAVWTIVGRSAAAKIYRGREAFMSEVIRPFNARMSAGLKPTIRNLYADGDTVIVFFDASATAHDGKPYTNTYAWFLHMRDGRIASAEAFFDSIEFNELWARVAPK